MAITPFEADLNIIGKLPDEPNDVGGLSSAELKARFDQAGNDIQKYVNETLIPQVIAFVREELEIHNNADNSHFMKFGSCADYETVRQHVTNYANPHHTNYALVGADKEGTAAKAVSAHQEDTRAHAALFAVKQDTLRGKLGQLVGFDPNGNAIPVDKDIVARDIMNAMPSADEVYY